MNVVVIWCYLKTARILLDFLHIRDVAHTEKNVTTETNLLL